MTNITGPERGDGGNNLDADSVNELLSGVLRLTAEVSAMRERVSIWERVLEARGLPVGQDDDDPDQDPVRHRISGADCGRVLSDVVVSQEAPSPDVADSGVGLLTRLTRLLRRSH